LAVEEQGPWTAGYDADGQLCGVWGKGSFMLRRVEPNAWHLSLSELRSVLGEIFGSDKDMIGFDIYSEAEIKVTRGADLIVHTAPEPWEDFYWFHSL